MGRPANEDALYWRAINQHKAYIIRAYVLRCGSVRAAADALGVSYNCLRKELVKLRTLGFIEKNDETGTGAENEDSDASSPATPGIGPRKEHADDDREAEAPSAALPPSPEG